MSLIKYNILLIDRLLSNKSDNEANDAIINIITSELFAAINGINKKRIEARINPPLIAYSVLSATK
mgnify:CR=1 FL=1